MKHSTCLYNSRSGLDCEMKLGDLLCCQLCNVMLYLASYAVYIAISIVITIVQ